MEHRNHKHIIDKFWMFVSDGKSVALDINTVTGEMVTRTSCAQPGGGNGPPPDPYTEDWARIVAHEQNRITRGASAGWAPFTLRQNR